MNDLSHSLYALDQMQWKKFLQFIEFFPSPNEPCKKMMQLAELIRKEDDKNLSAAYYSKKLYAEEKTSTTERVARMVKKKFLEFISLDCNLGSEEKDLDYIQIQLQKKSTQLRAFSRLKNSPGSQMDLLDDIIRQAKEYECYTVLVACLKLNHYALKVHRF